MYSLPLPHQIGCEHMSTRSWGVRRSYLGETFLLFSFGKFRFSLKKSKQKWWNNNSSYNLIHLNIIICCDVI